MMIYEGGGQGGREMVSGDSGRWTGLARMPSGYDIDPIATWAVLDITPGWIELRVRWPIMRVFQLITDVSVAPGDGVVVHPARLYPVGRKLPTRPGIALLIDRPHAGAWQRGPNRGGRLRPPAYYFWTRERDRVLATAAAAGFQVSTEERSIHARDHDPQ
jgi:hypothetical protein